MSAGNLTEGFGGPVVVSGLGPAMPSMDGDDIDAALPIRYSRGRDKWDAHPTQHEAADFDGFEAAFLAARSARKGLTYICAALGSDDQGRPYRCADKAMPRAFLPFDLDRIPSAEKFHELRAWFMGYRGFGYTTASHQPDAPRCRIVLAADRAMDRDEGQRACEAMQRRIEREFGAETFGFDRSVYRAEQPLFTPLHDATVFHFLGDPACVNDLLAEVSPVETHTTHSTPGERRDWLADLLDGDDVHGNACRLVGRLVAQGLDDETIRATMDVLATAVSARRGPQRAAELTGGELDRMIAGARRKGFGDAQESAGDGWGEPQSLTSKIEPEPYPLDALPSTIRTAVEEVASFVKAPIALVATSALGALSLACQAQADVKRADRLQGPCGLFTLILADSGERKSTCDGFFTQAIHDYEKAQADAAKPELKNHRAANEAWEAKRNGVKEKIRQLAKDGKPTADMESALRDLEHGKPEPPRIPRLLYVDATPESLAYELAKRWPSGGVVSAEAGLVFGSHGMGKDSIMRNLGLLNQLWDGTSLAVDRRSGDSFIVRGARLTMALQVQEPTLREFFARSGALARGTGFLARFLLAWPESTQGQRPFTDPPADWPHLSAFNRRIAALLDQPAAIDEDGALTPPVLPLSREAKAAWVKYHDAIERELSSGGELYDVRDAASKSADNAARLAALFQMFEGSGGAVDTNAFEGASRITAWHLHEARRFFGELALPAELSDAARLDAWLIEYCQRERAEHVDRREAQRGGPVRDGERLTPALRVLTELDRAREGKAGRRKLILLNPALLAEGQS